MYEYRKEYTSAQGSYAIVQVRHDGMERVVDEQHIAYVAFLEAGLVPTEVAYVESPTPPEAPADETSLRLDAIEAALLDLVRSV